MSNGGWNHRVIVKQSDHPANEGELYFEIHECHYNKREDTLPHSWTKDAIAPMGVDSIKELKSELRMMLAACGKPVLIERDGKLVEWEKPDAG